MVRGWARSRLRARQTRSRGDGEISSGPGDGRGPFGSRRSGPRPRRRASCAIEGQRSGVPGEGLLGDLGSPQSCASLVRPVSPSATAVIDHGASIGTPRSAIVCGGHAAASRRPRQNFAYRPRVHTSQSLTTDHLAPTHHHDDAPTHDLPTTQHPPTRPTSKHATQTPPHRKPSSPRPKPMTNARTRGRHNCRFRKTEPNGSHPGSDPRVPATRESLAAMIENDASRIALLVEVARHGLGQFLGTGRSTARARPPSRPLIVSGSGGVRRGENYAAGRTLEQTVVAAGPAPSKPKRVPRE